MTAINVVRFAHQQGQTRFLDVFQGKAEEINYIVAKNDQDVRDVLSRDPSIPTFVNMTDVFEDRNIKEVEKSFGDNQNLVFITEAIADQTPCIPLETMQQAKCMTMANFRGLGSRYKSGAKVLARLMDD